MHDDDHTTVGKLERDKRSPQKKAMLPKINGTPLLKWLAAFCVLNCVGAATEPWPVEFVAMSPCMPDDVLTALREESKAAAVDAAAAADAARAAAARAAAAQILAAAATSEVAKAELSQKDCSPPPSP